MPRNMETGDTKIQPVNATPPEFEKPAAMMEGSDAGKSADSLPGGEFPLAVYGSVTAAFVWMVVMSWFGFGSGREIDLDLSAVTMLGLVFLMLPMLIYVTARRHSKSRALALKGFLSSPVETATGTVSGRQAWLQMLLAPAALALAATLIGVVHLLS